MDDGAITGLKTGESRVVCAIWGKTQMPSHTQNLGFRPPLSPPPSLSLSVCLSLSLSLPPPLSVLSKSVFLHCSCTRSLLLSVFPCATQPSDTNTFISGMSGIPLPPPPPHPPLSSPLSLVEGCPKPSLDVRFSQCLSLVFCSVFSQCLNLVFYSLISQCLDLVF